MARIKCANTVFCVMCVCPVVSVVLCRYADRQVFGNLPCNGYAIFFVYGAVVTRVRPLPLV